MSISHRHHLIFSFTTSCFDYNQQGKSYHVYFQTQGLEIEKEEEKKLNIKGLLQGVVDIISITDRPFLLLQSL